MLNIDFFKVTYLDKMAFFSKFILFFLGTIVLIILKFFFQLFSRKISNKFVQIFHKYLLWLINIKVKVIGKPLKKNRGVLYVSNHISYIDIPLLGSLIPGKFIAKSEIADWPFIGLLSKIGNTIFVKRSLSYLKRNKTLIKDEIKNGENILLFPEGTTSDGVRVLDFKSSMFFSLEEENLTIQPLVIKYKTVNGLPINRHLKPMIAWYGDMGFKDHFKNTVKFFSISVTIIFLKPIKSKNFLNRKDMTFRLQNVIDCTYSNNFDF